MIRYTCPECGATVEVVRREELRTRPFCSARCRQIDLGKWLTGVYVVSDPLTIAPIRPDVGAEAADASDG